MYGGMFAELDACHERCVYPCDEITVTFPDGSTWAFWGYMRVFEPDALTEGEMPTATVTITPTNEDASHAERGPAISSVTGT